MCTFVSVAFQTKKEWLQKPVLQSKERERREEKSLKDADPRTMRNEL